MAKDYYQVLEVDRGAKQPEIQKAYLKLARKYHPDVNPDDKKAKDKFQEVQRAYEVLSDSEKRKLYDQFGPKFEEMGAGGPRMRKSGPGPGPGGQPFDFSDLFRQQAGEGAHGGFSDIFGQFADGGAKFRQARPRTGAGTVEHQIEIPFNTAVLGGEVQLSLTRDKGPPETIQVKIPPGIEDGQKIRLRGQGAPIGRKKKGDLLVKVHVIPHSYFRRRKKNLELRVPITLGESVNGATIDVPSPGGTIAVKVPAGCNSGSKLRIKGQGVRSKSGKAGDLYVEVQIVLPKTIDAESKKWCEKFDANYTSDPREKLKW